MSEKITQTRLKELLSYDPNTGLFIWLKLKTGNQVRVGDVAGYNASLRGKYVDIRLDKKLYKAHRLVFLYMTGKFPNEGVDHIDGNGMNNKWCNLRDVDQHANMKNTKISSNNKTGVIGIHMGRGRYVAQIKHQGETKHLGIFSTLDEAVKARKIAESRYGYHKNHGRLH